MSSDAPDDRLEPGVPGERRARSTEDSSPKPEVEDLAFQDDLTGLKNRRFVHRLLTSDWQSFIASHPQVSFVVIDLDGFKAVNDRYGHRAGDEVLRVVARLLHRSFREDDFVVRYGGDEFLVVLPGAGEEAAAALAVRARDAVDGHAFSESEGGHPINLPLSFSIGVATYPTHGSTGDEVIEKADRRLYQEKRQRTAREAESRRPRLATSIWLLVVAILISVGAYSTWTRTRPRILTPAEAPIAARRAVAVLGFRNLSGRSDTAWLSTAFAEMLSSELAAAETLRVIPGEAVARTRVELKIPESDSLAADTLARLHASLGSDIVVVGSYFATASSERRQIRLDVRLQDAAGGESLGAISQTGTEAELLPLVARTGLALRQKLGVTILPARAATTQAAMPASRDATRLYAEGLTKLRGFDALGARELLEQAIAAAPGSPLAHSALAEAWAVLGYDLRARDEAKKAFELSAILPREERLLVEARYRESSHEWQRAIELYQTLFRFAPDSLEYGLALARTQRLSGKGQNARTTLVALRKLPPPAGNDARIDLADAETAAGFDEIVVAARRAVAKSRQQGARLLQARARLIEAYALGEKSEYVAATAAAEEARQIYIDAGDRDGLAKAINRLATVRPNQDDLAGARALYEQALGIAREVGDRRWTGQILNNTALTWSDQGDLDRAKPLFDEALAIFDEIGATRSRGHVLLNLGRNLNSQGHPIEARGLLTQALAIYREISDDSGVVYALNNLGNSAHLVGDLAGAERLYGESLPLCLELGDKRITSFTLLNQGELLEARGDLAEARKKYLEAIAIRDDIGVKLDAAEGRLTLARLAILEGQAKAAEQFARPALDLFIKEKAGYTVAVARAILAQSLLSQGRVAEAEATLAPALSPGVVMQKASVRFLIGTTDARVRARMGRSSEAVRKLNALVDEARRVHLAEEQFEARLALGEVELGRGDGTRGRSILATLQHDANAKGYILMARRAAAAKSSPRFSARS